MDTALAIPRSVQGRGLQLFDPTTVSLIGAATATLAEPSRVAYEKAYRSLAAFMGIPDPEDALRALISSTRGQCHSVILAWIDQGGKDGLSPAYLNQRLSAVQAVLRYAQEAELITWSIRIKRFPTQALKDTRGPGAEKISQAIRGLGERTSVKAIRDRAIVTLLFTNALRRAELVGLDLEHLDLEASTLSILGKGRRERETVTLPPETVAALRTWVEVRGSCPGPLFRSCDRAGKGDGRLTGSGLWALVRKLGLLRTHAVRHSAITAVLDMNNGNIRQTSKFSRHLTSTMVERYDDNRQDIGGEAARKLAAAWCR